MEGDDGRLGSSTMTKKPGFYGWTLVAVLFALDFSFMGFNFYGGSVINTYMLKQIPMSRGLYGLGFTLTNLFVGLPSTLVAVVILRWGLKTSFGIGAALLLAGSVWLAFFASRPWHYLASFGVLIGTGLCFATNVPVATAVTRWFKRYRGRAMGIALSASGMAGFLCLPVVNRILAANGGDWRQAWEIISVITLVAGIVALLFVRERPEDLGQAVDGASDTASAQLARGAESLVTNHSWTASEAYRTRPYWIICISGVACKYPYFFITAHWVLHLKGAGISAADAAMALGLFTLGGLSGRLLGGWLMDKMVARYALMLGFCCYLVAVGLALRVSAHALLVADAAAILFGLGFGWTFIAVYTVVGHFYGPAAYPKLSGMMALISSVTAAPSSAIGGRLFDAYGSYTPAFELIAVVTIVAMATLALATMPQPVATAGD